MNSKLNSPISTLRLWLGLAGWIALSFSAAAMGALFMHLMLETIAMGRLMGVDPFDQPAVE